MEAATTTAAAMNTAISITMAGSTPAGTITMASIITEVVTKAATVAEEAEVRTEDAEVRTVEVEVRMVEAEVPTAAAARFPGFLPDAAGQMPRDPCARSSPKGSHFPA
jgi:phage tail tube protein FII